MGEQDFAQFEFKMGSGSQQWSSWDRLMFVAHYNDIIIGAMASQIISLIIVYSAVYSDADKRKYQSSASLAFVQGIHRWPVNSPHKGSVTRKMSPFHDVIMENPYTSKMAFLYWDSAQIPVHVLDSTLGIDRGRHADIKIRLLETRQNKSRHHTKKVPQGVHVINWFTRLKIY